MVVFDQVYKDGVSGGDNQERNEEFHFRGPEENIQNQARRRCSARALQSDPPALSKIWNKRVHVKEIKCNVNGDEHCEYEIRF
ncbi:V4R domain protein [compost metagenome]